MGTHNVTNHYFTPNIDPFKTLGRGDTWRIYGGGENDILYGADSDDTIFGNNGDDNLYGKSGRDYLDGQNGNDYSVGNNGNDILIGGNGNDILYGGFDGSINFKLNIDEITANKPTENGLFNDRDEVYFIVTGASTNGLINIPRVSPPGSDSDEKYDYYYGFHKNDVSRNISLSEINLKPGEDAYLNVLVREQDGNFWEIFKGAFNVLSSFAKTTFALFTNPITSVGELPSLVKNSVDLINTINQDDDDKHQTIGAFGVHIKNQNGSLITDWISVDNTTIALENNSSATIIADGADANYVLNLDNLISNYFEPYKDENGNEYLYVYDGRDTLYGGDGNDSLIGGSEEDELLGGNHNDSLFGQDGNDSLNGENGNDSLLGGNENDSLSGGDGNDFLDGEEGDDSLIGGKGSDSIYGGEGNDSLYAASVSITQDTFCNCGGNNYLDGGNGNDLLYGFGKNDRLLGGSGHDRIYAGSGEDTLQGNQGDDLLNGGHDKDNLGGGSGNDTLNGDFGDDFLYGQSGNDILNGGYGNDYLHGDVGNDSLNGGVGNDSLLGLKGSDTLTGGEGKDRFVYTTLFNDTDIITDFNLADDVIAFNTSFAEDLTGFHHLDNVTSLGVTGAGIYWDSNGNDNNSGELIAILQGHNANDLNLSDPYFQGIILSSNYEDNTPPVIQNTINGTEGKDTLNGTSTNDEINGFGGKDKLIGGWGHDSLNGGDDDDFLFGNFDNDTLNGDGGNDYLHGFDGNDSLNGGSGHDKLIGLKGSDTLTGGAGNDRFAYFTLSEDTSNDRDVITDLNLTEDVIAFHPDFAKGATGFHHLENVTSLGVSGAGVYWDSNRNDNNPGELIAILQGHDANDLDLSDRYFQNAILD